MKKTELRDRIIYMAICSANNNNWEDVSKLLDYWANKENLNYRMFKWVSMNQKEGVHKMVEDFFKEEED